MDIFGKWWIWFLIGWIVAMFLPPQRVLGFVRRGQSGATS